MAKVKGSYRNRQGCHWSEGLLLELSRPENWILYNQNVVVVPDRFPKAMYHFLVLPRANIPSIFELTRNDLWLIEEMFSMAQNVIKMKGRRKEEFRIGFHAEPSLKQVHMHVISTDFNSPTLKTQRHWNSFNTELFIPHEVMVCRIMTNGCITKMPPWIVSKLRDTPLRCHLCFAQPKSIEELKSHLQLHLKWR